MTTLHLVRHGQTNWNAERRCQGQCESELDEIGRQQAEARRQAMAAIQFTGIYSSTSIRTRQTTEILARNIALPVTYLDSLREIFLGDWETKLWDDIHAAEPVQAKQFHVMPHHFNKSGAESYSELRDRGVATMEQIIKEQPAGNILVISHGGLLKATMTHYAGVELQRLVDTPGLSNCSHSELSAEISGQRKLVTIDSVPLEQTEWHT